MQPWAEIAGAEAVRPGTPGDAVAGVVPPAVVRPGNVEAVQRVVRVGAPLVASGLGAHLDIGAAPRALEVLLRLDRLDRLLAHEAGDMTVTAEAGCPLPAIERALATAGQWLPLDPPRADRTTVGGLVAAGLSGPLRASQGTVRDLLLGVRVVEADGALVTGGGKVVKNVAGYDLPKLHVGALGTLGVIVEATFKVRPRPERETAVVVRCRTIEEAGELALAVRDLLDPTWLEVGSAGWAPAAEDPEVIVGLAGLAPEVEEAEDRLRTLVASRRLHHEEVAGGATLRRRCADFETGAGAALLRATGLATEVAGILAAAEEAARGLGTRVRCLAHAANGIVRIAVDDRACVGPLVERLRPSREAAGGSLVVWRAGPEVKRALSVWGDLGQGAGLMRRLRAASDPGGILAPGRLLEEP